MVPLNG